MLDFIERKGVYMARRRRNPYRSIRIFVLSGLLVLILIAVSVKIDEIILFFDNGGSIVTPIEEDQVIEIPKEPQAVMEVATIDVSDVKIGDDVESTINALRTSGYTVKRITKYVLSPQEGITAIDIGDTIVVRDEALRTQEILVALQEALKTAGYYTIRDGGYGPSMEKQLLAFKKEVMEEHSADITSEVIESLEAMNAPKMVKDINAFDVIVNSENNLASTDVPLSLIEFKQESGNAVKLRVDIHEALTSMLAAAAIDGESLVILEGYQDYAEQEAIFNKVLRRSDYNSAKEETALPGQSEHQTGLAIDVDNVKGNVTKSQAFSNTTEYQWLLNNSYKYGFVLRYPEGKEAITGREFMPWHYRYVGVELAKKLVDTTMTLEEYINKGE